MKASEFDRKFDDGGSVAAGLDLSKLRRHAQEQRRVNVDFSSLMIESLARKAKRSGVGPSVHYKGPDR